MKAFYLSLIALVITTGCASKKTEVKCYRHYYTQTEFKDHQLEKGDKVRVKSDNTTTTYERKDCHEIPKEDNKLDFVGYGISIISIGKLLL